MTIKSGDTGITFTDTLTLAGSPFDLTGCTTLFRLRPNTGGITFSDTATNDPDQVNHKGQVSYQPGTGFPTQFVGYWQDWHVTTGAGKVLTFPGDTYNTVRIIEAI